MPSENYAQTNYQKVKSSAPIHNAGMSAIYDSPGANSPMTLNVGASIFGSVDKKAVTVPSPLTSGYNRVAFVTNSGNPFAQTRKNVYFIDRYSTLIGNTTTTVMQSPARAGDGRTSINGMISAVSSPWQSGKFDYISGTWLINVSTASGYNMLAVSGNAPVDQNLHLTRQQGGSITFTVGKTAIRQRYLGQTD